MRFLDMGESYIYKCELISIRFKFFFIQLVIAWRLKLNLKLIVEPFHAFMRVELVIELIELG